jgi:hypothetical protein
MRLIVNPGGEAVGRPGPRDRRRRVARYGALPNVRRVFEREGVDDPADIATSATPGRWSMPWSRRA